MIEEWDLSRSPHRPLHWYEDQGCYWVTGATLHHIPHLRRDDRKQRFVDELYPAAERWGVTLVAWTLMEHHYHMVLRAEVGRSLPRFFGRLHGKTASFVNEQDGAPGRTVWRQYWDTRLRSEGDFWSRINYTWWNPVKHGFCEKPEDWSWTNLALLMAAANEDELAALVRFPAPRKLPGDDC